MRDNDYDDDSDMEYSTGTWTRGASIVVILFVLSILLLALTGSMCFGQVDSPSTCRLVEFDSRNGIATGYGSGVLVAKADGVGYVLTAKHVVESEESHSRYQAIFPHSKSLTFPVRTQWTSNADLAVVTIAAPTDIAPRPIAWRIPDTGEQVWQSAYGNHKDKPREAWSRVLPLVKQTSAGRQEWVTPSLLLVDRPSRSGDSGGPIIDKAGRVVGIISGTTKSQGFHVTVGDQAWLRELLPRQEHSILVKP